MANPAIVVDFVANTRDLQKGFGQATGASSKFGSKLKGLATGVATAGFAALVATVKTGVDEFSEASKVSAQTGAVLKSTGKAANVTADQVSSLAEALMKKSGVDDEVIQSGENVLLTFTNIRNEAGKGNDVFNQTTKAALDMSVALGTDMKTASMTLGKALNDPLKGMSKLTKQGVTFTDAQKKQVEAMVKSGDVMGAQKIILAELNKEFGGSAEAAGKTLPGQLNILKQEFSNLAGELVSRMVPVLTTVAKFLNENRTAVIAVAAVIGTLTAATLAVSAATAAWNTLQVIAKGAAVAWAAAQWLINAALTANPIGIVIVAIGALVAAMVVAYKTSDTFRRIVDNAFDAVKAAAQAAFNWIKQNWPLLVAILTGPIGVATLAVVRNWDTISDAVKTAINTAKTVLNSFKDWLSTTFLSAFRATVNIIGDVWDRVADGARSAASSVKAAFNSLIDWLGGIVDRISSAASRIASAIKAPINAVISRWNSLSFTIPKVTIPSIKIGKKKIGGGSIGGSTISFPNITPLATGGIVTAPTLAMVGESGPEAVIPLTSANAPIEVRVFIGDTELKGLVRTEVTDVNTGLARTLLAGKAG